MLVLQLKMDRSQSFFLIHTSRKEYHSEAGSTNSRQNVNLGEMTIPDRLKNSNYDIEG